MPTNRNALIRHRALDRCFRNSGRRYTFEDLREEVILALQEFNPHIDGISDKTLRNDLRFFRRLDGYDAPLETCNGADKPYYRYSDPKFSISNRPLNDTEAEQLSATIALLSRFVDNPNMPFLDEVIPRLQEQFGLQASDRKVMEFQANPYYAGSTHITPIFNAITNKRTLEVVYKPFDEEPFTFTFHPHFLKQYNDRWFALGYNEQTENPRWNLALDRIQSLTEISTAYRDCEIDWEDHFDAIYGITRPSEVEPVEVELLFDAARAPYVHTKPIHPTQKKEFHPDGSMTVRLELIPNLELESLILGFGDSVEVIAPDSLKRQIAQKLEAAAEKYRE